MRFVPFAVLLLALPTLAQTPEVRFDLGQRLRAFEQALEASPPGAQRDQAVVGLKNLTTTFFSFQFGKAGQMLDEARLALTKAAVTDADRWAASLNVTPATRLLDVTAKELPVTLPPFYTVKATAPEKAQVTLVLVDAQGKAVATATTPLDKVTLSLSSPPPGEYTLRAEIAVGASKLTRTEQTVSVVERLKERLDTLTAATVQLRDKDRSTDRDSLLRLVRDLESLAAGKQLETNYPAHRLLKEAEDGVAAVLAGKPYYGQQRPGDYSLNLATKAGHRVRLWAPDQAKGGAPLPLVVALHGAGGSENMFFDGYGDGLVRKLAAERGWLLVAPAVGFLGGFNSEVLGEIEKLYAVDRSRVFILGHSMGAAATMTAVSTEPTLYRAAAALGGSGTVKASADLKKVPIFVGVGDKDFALSGAKALHERLKKAEVARVQFKEYANVEHLTVVQLSLRDVFAFFDATLEK